MQIVWVKDVKTYILDMRFDFFQDQDVYNVHKKYNLKKTTLIYLFKIEKVLRHTC